MADIKRIDVTQGPGPRMSRCVVRGDTRHYEHVADECAAGLMRVALDSGVPVLNGVLAVERFDDAQARAGGARGNKGEEVALAALEMADLLRRL